MDTDTLEPGEPVFRVNDAGYYVTEEEWCRVWALAPEPWWERAWMITDNGQYDFDEVAAMTVAEVEAAWADPPLHPRRGHLHRGGQLMPRGRCPSAMTGDRQGKETRMSKNAPDTDRLMNTEVCPVCGSADIVGEQVEIEVDVAVQDLCCTSCGAVWYDTYGFYGRHVDRPDDPVAAARLEDLAKDAGSRVSMDPGGDGFWIDCGENKTEASTAPSRTPRAPSENNPIDRPGRAPSNVRRGPSA